MGIFDHCLPSLSQCLASQIVYFGDKSVSLKVSNPLLCVTSTILDLHQILICMGPQQLNLHESVGTGKRVCENVSVCLSMGGGLHVTTTLTYSNLFTWGPPDPSSAALPTCKSHHIQTTLPRWGRHHTVTPWTCSSLFTWTSPYDTGPAGKWALSLRAKDLVRFNFY